MLIFGPPRVGGKSKGPKLSFLGRLRWQSGSYSSGNGAVSVIKTEPKDSEVDVPIIKTEPKDSEVDAQIVQMELDSEKAKSAARSMLTMMGAKT